MSSGDELAPEPRLAAVAASADADLPIRNLNTNGSKLKDTEEHEAESELSEPDSNVNSPPSAPGLAELDEIVVGAHANRESKVPSSHVPSEAEDQTMEDVEPVSPSAAHYPKRKRSSLDNGPKEGFSASDTSRLHADDDSSSPEDVKARPNRQTLSGAKGVLLGVWRDSNVPTLARKHAVTGFIDIRDRLRTRVQPQTMEGESLAEDYPLPPGPGGSWVTFDRVIFSDHLIGLDQVMVKEYTRIRSHVPAEETEEERKRAEADAVKESIRRVKDNTTMENPTTVPSIAHGVDLPDHMTATTRPDAKRRKTLNSFLPTSGKRKSPGELPLAPDILRSQTPPQPLTARQTRFSVDPLPGTRPTRILLGHWRPSSEPDPRDRHAVYGILGQNDMFRVKIVRETRDGRFVDGNYPTGAGALWIPYEEVEFEDHLKALSRLEVKEYCRIRQYQLDNGETEANRIENETKAVYEAQTRAGTSAKLPSSVVGPTFSATSRVSDVDMQDRPSSRTGYGGHELRQSRRLEPRPEPRPDRPDRGNNIRHSLTSNEGDMRPLPRIQGLDAVERTSALARREIARVEAAQGRADRHALTRERAAAAAADAVSAAAAAAAASMPPPQQPMPLQHAPLQPLMQPPPTNGRALFHESEDMQRLNKVWARQESLRVKAGAEDAKIYDGVKYERKANGPFMGKLVSQGTIINIDGEDYVEYRVLTKPSFF
ncbi:hypothetical protein CDD82_3850 [Ophiocordyceps australis]|uniref:Uncharacterized protein n=1 Tax=Ophiocordyceps australis TaxID=1399860 RepID=A0A2C5ZA82_9HYPO|nr:hypothetical protein CDD82_3850 [Ophiocordyceps australis]